MLLKKFRETQGKLENLENLENFCRKLYLNNFVCTFRSNIVEKKKKKPVEPKHRTNKLIKLEIIIDGRARCTISTWSPPSVHSTNRRCRIRKRTVVRLFIELWL